jgi:hypothetical protein
MILPSNQLFPFFESFCHKIGQSGRIQGKISLGLMKLGVQLYRVSTTFLVY